MASATDAQNKREPPPALFLHPSPAASHVSLPGILAPGAPAAGPPPLPARREQSSLDVNAAFHARPGATLDPARPTQLVHTESARNADHTDALWAEMQATLEEVELSASGGTHVFGPEHEAKLVELRTAQIALAQAWARSEADDAIETNVRDNAGSAPGGEVRNLKGALAETSRPRLGDGTEAARSAVHSNGPASTTSGAEGLGAKLEEETEVDILLARKRREANDEYFQRVNDGVLDVVAKLDDVAVAMRTVEQESRDIWSESDNVSERPRS